MVGLISLVVGCNSGRNLEDHLDSSSVTDSSITYQSVSYDALNKPVQKALKHFGHSSDSHYDDFNFHLDSTFSASNNKVRFDLTAKYNGDTPFSGEVRLRYLTCGVSNVGLASCFGPPEYKTLPEQGKKTVQPGEVIHQTVEITYGKNVELSRERYLVPHVDVFFGNDPDQKVQSAVFLKK